MDSPRERPNAMPSHPFSPDCGCPACWHTVCLTLVALRDALMELSLALEDLQFACDLERRKLCQRTVQDLMQRLTANPSSRFSRSRPDADG